MYTPLQNILIADDNSDDIAIFETVVGKLPYANLIVAKDGKEAVLKSKNPRLALIFLDISMPELNGFESAEEILKISEAKGVPIIFQSADHDQGAIDRAKNLGAIDYITKPYDIKEIRSKIEKYLSEYVVQTKKRAYGYLKLRLSEIFFLCKDKESLEKGLRQCYEASEMETDGTPHDEYDLKIEPFLIALHNICNNSQSFKVNKNKIYELLKSTK
jgi:CheY-like chemotaxis protein